MSAQPSPTPLDPRVAEAGEDWRACVFVACRRCGAPTTVLDVELYGDAVCLECVAGER